MKGTFIAVAKAERNERLAILEDSVLSVLDEEADTRMFASPVMSVNIIIRYNASTAIKGAENKNASSHNLMR